MTETATVTVRLPQALEFRDECDAPYVRLTSPSGATREWGGTARTAASRRRTARRAPLNVRTDVQKPRNVA